MCAWMGEQRWRRRRRTGGRSGLAAKEPAAVWYGCLAARWNSYERSRRCNHSSAYGACGPRSCGPRSITPRGCDERSCRGVHQSAAGAHTGACSVWSVWAEWACARSGERAKGSETGRRERGGVCGHRWDTAASTRRCSWSRRSFAWYVLIQATPHRTAGASLGVGFCRAGATPVPLWCWERAELAGMRRPQQATDRDDARALHHRRAPYIPLVRAWLTQKAADEARTVAVAAVCQSFSQPHTNASHQLASRLHRRSPLHCAPAQFRRRRRRAQPPQPRRRRHCVRRCCYCCCCC
jgi:hypothetical protein